MVKVLLDKYPMGTVKGQKSAGRYIDGYLYNTLKDLADVIVDDMTFLGIIFSSTLEVGTGKSVLGTQIEEVWAELIKQKHKIDIPVTTHNIVWRPKLLIERAFDVPKYSPILLDEWEDASYWSQLGMSLRQFFRKCRQLNLFMIIIIPNFFQLPLQYAISRSVFAIDVRFEGKFKRGFFSFYGFEAKKKLYILGKKFHNYRAAQPDFVGRFTDGYGVPEEEYRAAKLEDLKAQEAEDPDLRKPEKLAMVVKNLKDRGFKQTEIAEITMLSQGAVSLIVNGKSFGNLATANSLVSSFNTYNKKLKEKETVWDEEELESAAT